MASPNNKMINPFSIMMKNRNNQPFKHTDSIPEAPKPFFEHFLRTNSEHLKLIPRDTKNIRREDVWEKFGVIQWKEETTKYAVCLKCREMSKISMFCFGGGMSQMNRHLSDCHSEKQLNQNTEIATNVTNNYFNLPIPFLTAKSLTSKNKTRLAQAAADVCIFDLRPFSHFKGDGMSKFLSEFQDVIVNQGIIKDSDLKIDPMTVRRHVLAKQKANEKKVIELLSTVKSVSLVSDHWTDRHGTDVYFGITASTLDLQNGFVSVPTLGVISVPDSTAKTTKSVLEQVKHHFQIEDKVSMAVTDNCSALMKAFEHDVIRCAGHNLNLVLNHGYYKYVSGKEKKENTDAPANSKPSINLFEEDDFEAVDEEIDDFLDELEQDGFHSDSESEEEFELVSSSNRKRISRQPVISNSNNKIKKLNEMAFVYKKHFTLISNCKSLVRLLFFSV